VTSVGLSLFKYQDDILSNKHNDTTPPQPNHTVTPTHIEPEQYNHTQSQAPEDECTSIRNMLIKK
jgi:hypothetical protein